MGKPVEVLRKHVRALIAKEGISQADLARRLGWEPSHLSAYLGNREPGLDKVAELADAFGVSVADLFRAESEPKPRVERQSIPESMREDILAIARQAAVESIDAYKQLSPAKRDLFAAMLATIGDAEDAAVSPLIPAVRAVLAAVHSGKHLQNILEVRDESHHLEKRQLKRKKV